MGWINSAVLPFFCLTGFFGRLGFVRMGARDLPVRQCRQGRRAQEGTTEGGPGQRGTCVANFRF